METREACEPETEVDYKFVPLIMTLAQDHGARMSVVASDGYPSGLRNLRLDHANLGAL